MQEDTTNTLPGADGWMSESGGNADGASRSTGITEWEGEQPPEAEAGLEKPAIDELQAVASAFTAAFNTALYELETSRTQLEERSARIGELDDAIVSIRAALDAEVGKGHAREEEYSRTTAELNQKIAGLESERAHLQETVRELESLTVARADEIGRLSARMEELDAILEQRAVEARHARQEFEQEKDMLSGANEALQVRLDQKENELLAVQGVLEERDNELAGLRSLHDARTGELQSKISEISGLEQQISELKEELEARSEAMHRKIEQHAHATEELNTQVADVTRELDVLRLAHEELAAHAEKLETLNGALHESSISKSAVHKQQLDEKSSEIALLRSRLEKAKAASNRAVELENQVDTLRELEKKLKETQAQKQALDSKARQVSELEAENERLRAALEASAGPAGRGEEDTRKLQGLQEQLAELQSMLDSSRSEQKCLAEQMHDYEQLRQEVAVLRELVRQAEDRQGEGGETLEAAGDEAGKTGTAQSASEPARGELEAVLPDVTDSDHSGSQPAGDQRRDPGEPASDRSRFVAGLDGLLSEERDSGTSHNLMYILLDSFIQVRDEIGVMESEHVIKEVSEIIASFRDGDDTMSRFGDCTFAMICSGESLAETEEKAERIRSAIENRVFEYGGRSVVTTASIGICSVRKSDTSAADVISRADLACEAARSFGGNQVVVSSAIADNVIRTGAGDNNAAMIRATLDERRARIYYQPITSLMEQLDNHYEILIRIIDESGNIILPGEFFSMAGKCGQAASVDRYVVENVMKMMAENRGQEMTLFIKLTGQTVADQDFPVWMMHKIKEYRINPAQLVFEVAENLLQSDIKNLSMLSRALNTVGCKIALEHYRMSSSPQHLMHIHANYLKIDRGLIESISRKGASLLKVAAIMKMAKQNDYITIAEGVESPAALAMLCELGVNMAQGYFIQAPAGNRDFDFRDLGADDELEEGHKAIFRIG